MAGARIIPDLAGQVLLGGCLQRVLQKVKEIAFGKQPCSACVAVEVARAAWGLLIQGQASFEPLGEGLNMLAVMPSQLERAIR